MDFVIANRCAPVLYVSVGRGLFYNDAEWRFKDALCFAWLEGLKNI